MDGEDADIVGLECPACGEDSQEVLRAADAGWTLRCANCKAVRTVPAPPKPKLGAVPVVLAEGATSRSTRLDVALDEPLAVGDEFDLEGHRVKLTAIERPDGTRPKSANGREVKALYAVLFDTVTVHYTVNKGDVTRSFREDVSPELELHVGTVRNVQGYNLAIKTLKSDQNRTLHRGFLLARNVHRVFADLAPEGARPGDKVATRERGAGPGGSKGGPRSRVKR